MRALRILMVWLLAMQKLAFLLKLMCTNIDYMGGCKDFTFDPVNFSLEQMRKFGETLHQNGQKFVLILDPDMFKGNIFTWKSSEL